MTEKVMTVFNNTIRHMTKKNRLWTYGRMLSRLMFESMIAWASGKGSRLGRDNKLCDASLSHS